MHAERTPQHEWLLQLVGEWTSETACGPEGSPLSGGREVVRAIGDVWIVLEGEMPMPDADPMRSVMTLGVDPFKGFVGTWIGSPMANLVVYDGTLDESAGTLTLACEAPSMDDPTKLVPYLDVVELRGPNERALVSKAKGPDGEWIQFMEAVYRRVN